MIVYDFHHPCQLYSLEWENYVLWSLGFHFQRPLFSRSASMLHTPELVTEKLTMLLLLMGRQPGKVRIDLVYLIIDECAVIKSIYERTVD